MREGHAREKGKRGRGEEKIGLSPSGFFSTRCVSYPLYRVFRLCLLCLNFSVKRIITTIQYYLPRKILDAYR